MVKLKRKYIPLVQAVLNEIRREMDRLYWNKYQCEMNSPFDNTGEEYENQTFQVYAYYWGEDDELINRPNFKYKDLSIFWYKHNNRGLDVYYSKDRISAEYLVKMLKDCKVSLIEDFGEKE